MPETKEQQIPAVIQEQLDSLERVRQNILDMIPMVSIAEDLIAKFSTLPGTSEWKIAIGYGSGSLNGVLVHVNSLDFRELTPVRRWLRGQGFPAPITEDYAEISRRSWTYRQKDKPNLVFSAFAGDICNRTKLEGQKCEFVKVGMKDPEPIYELRCDGKKLEEDNHDRD